MLSLPPDHPGSEHLFDTAAEIGQKIEQVIREEIQLVASAAG